jgi:hypothetical protein
MLVFLISIAMIMYSSGVYFAEYVEDGCREGDWSHVLEGACSEANGWMQREHTAVFESVDDATETVECECGNPNPFTSIPATFWYILVTMTTVGYGDHVPVTPLGKLVAVFAMISGIIILALPITVIGTNFARVLREIQQEKVLAELEAIDKDGDGVVSVEELRVMLKNMTAMAGGADLDTAEELIAKYDADNSGYLEAHEVAALKAELFRKLKPPEDDDDGATGGSAKPIAKVVNSDADGGSPDELSAGGATPSTAGAVGGPVGSMDTMGGGGGSRTLPTSPLRRPPGAETGARTHAGAEGTANVPLPHAVAAKLQDMEMRVDSKLRAMLELLRKMNAAVAQTTSAEPIL